MLRKRFCTLQIFVRRALPQISISKTNRNLGIKLKFKKNENER